MAPIGALCLRPDYLWAQPPWFFASSSCYSFRIFETGHVTCSIQCALDQGAQHVASFEIFFGDASCNAADDCDHAHQGDLSELAGGYVVSVHALRKQKKLEIRNSRVELREELE